MVPNFPILNRGVYRSGYTGSFYDPRTLITKIVAPKFNYLDEDDLFLKTYEYSATLIHERVHWLQHHGTSFGCFLGALRLSQQSTTLRVLREENFDQIEILLERRNKDGRSILNLNPETQYPTFTSNSEVINLFGQIWFDHQWVHNIFDNSQCVERKPGVVPGKVIGEVISDVVIAFREYNSLLHSNDINIENSLEVRQWFSIEDSEMVFVSMFGMRLTSKLIMESPALISELQILSAQINYIGKSGKRKALESRIKTIVNGDYGIPIRCLLKVLNMDLNSLQRVLPTVNVICFIALNPPLPPYVINPPENCLSWSWQDIYPPIRFARLSHCVWKIGLLKDRSNHKEISEYIEKICNLCNIPHTINTYYPDIRDREFLDFSNPDNISNDFFKSYEYREFSHNDYIFWVQSRLAEYKMKSLPLLVNLGDCMSGDLLIEHYSDMVVYDEIPFTICPLRWTDDDQVGFSCSPDFGNWLLRSVLLEYVLFDVVAGNGQYDLNEFPKEVRESDEIQSILANSIHASLKTPNY